MAIEQLALESATAWDTAAWREERDQKLLEWFKHNREAVTCVVAISGVCEVWDDLHDGDSVSTEDIDKAFVKLFLQLNSNSFFEKHRTEILAVMVVVINGWQDSNLLLESDSKDDRIKAYVLRNLGSELIPLFAYWIGGYDHMRRISLEVREFISHENFEQWEQEHA